MNAVLAARSLNISLIRPGADLIGRGNELLEPPNASYVGIYADRSNWGRFGQLWDTAHFEHSLSRLRVHVVAESPRGARLAHLPPPVHQDCEAAHVPTFRDTCAPHAGDSRLFDRMIERWRRTVAAHGCRGPSGASAESTPNRPTVFDVGRGICWNVYESRDVETCAAQFSGCRAAALALRSNDLIQELRREIEAGVATRLQSRAPGVSNRSWAAMHVREWSCRANPTPADARLSADALERTLRDHGRGARPRPRAPCPPKRTLSSERLHLVPARSAARPAETHATARLPHAPCQLR